MALFKCSRCGNMVSDKAAACPKCGHPVNEDAQSDKFAGLEQTPRKKNTTLMVLGTVLGIVLLLTLLAGGAYLYLKGNSPETVALADNDTTKVEEEKENKDSTIKALDAKVKELETKQAEDSIKKANEASKPVVEKPKPVLDSDGSLDYILEDGKFEYYGTWNSDYYSSHPCRLKFEKRNGRLRNCVYTNLTYNNRIVLKGYIRDGVLRFVGRRNGQKVTMKFRVDSHAHDLYGEGIDNASNDRANVYFSTEYEGEN